MALRRPPKRSAKNGNVSAIAPREIDPTLVIRLRRRQANVLPFSSERQGRIRAYHGREEPRAQPAASRHQPTYERTRVAFVCCNGWFGSDRSSAQGSPVADRLKRLGNLSDGFRGPVDVPDVYAAAATLVLRQHRQT